MDFVPKLSRVADASICVRATNDFNRKYPALVHALSAMPDETVIDGEGVALDSSGRPSFNELQNYRAGAATIVFYAFDVMVLNGRDVTAEPLTARRALLSPVLVNLGEPVRESSELDASLPDLIRSVKAHGLEGLVAKLRDSRYEPGQRSGVWLKMRVTPDRRQTQVDCSRGEMAGEAVVSHFSSRAPKAWTHVIF
jgi:ATP-dependent DNA ligase